MSDNDVPDVNEARARRDRERLERLLDRRERLATRAAELRSHGLPQSLEELDVMYLIEEVIDEEWPDVFHAQIAAWATHDDDLLHSPMQVDPRCRICQRKAGHGGPAANGHTDVA